MTTAKWSFGYDVTAFRLICGNMTGAVFQYQQDKYIHVLIIRKKRHKIHYSKAVRLLRSWATTNQSARRTHYIV